jgi:Cu2+-exporting ATPase
VVFDKTGTLTHGRPELIRVTAIHGDRERALTLAASLEQASEHPLAAPFLAHLERRALVTVQGAENTPGRGVSGSVDGRRYWLGNASWMAEHGVATPVVEGEGTQVWLFDEARALAWFEFADGLRKGAAAAVEDLRQHGLSATILSGDGEAAVARAARDLGIEDWRSGLKPADKLMVLKAMQDRGEVVLMLGDGVNDAPVLAGADVSLAMGGGTQVARASSDIVLLNENLRDAAQAVRAGRDCVTIMKQNFGWAIAYNVVALPVAALGWVPPWLAALGMSLSSLVVVTNALRLRNSEGI